jgi:hypothetical protein
VAPNYALEVTARIAIFELSLLRTAAQQGAHTAARRAPHSPQNFRAEGFSC